ncbi:MAG: flagellin [bacterium]|nr:flagellin [bacterium]
MAIGDSTRINTNIAAFNALHALKSVNSNLEKSQLRLATGRRINEVADDPAGYTISKRLEGRIVGLTTAYDNVGTAKNVLSIAEGGLMNIQDILITMKEKVTQAKSDTMGTNERNAIKAELNELTAEIDDIVSETEFNGVALLDGSYTSKSYQTGEGVSDTLSYSLSQNFAAASVSVASGDVGNSVSTSTLAATALGNVNTALTTVADELQSLGATIARLTVKESTLSVAITNTRSTRSRIMDADIASEQLNSTRLQILQQTATAQLAQANVIPQNVLALFT